MICSILLALFLIAAVVAWVVSRALCQYLNELEAAEERFNE